MTIRENFVGNGSSFSNVNMSADFSRFTTKGQPHEIALQRDNYTSSFGQIMSRDRDQAKLFMVNSRGLLSPNTPHPNNLQVETNSSSLLHQSEMMRRDKKSADQQGVKLVFGPGRRNHQWWAKTLDSMSMSIRDVSSVSSS